MPQMSFCTQREFSYKNVIPHKLRNIAIRFSDAWGRNNFPYEYFFANRISDFAIRAHGD